jgi:hypothetical protein
MRKGQSRRDLTRASDMRQLTDVYELQLAALFVAQAASGTLPTFSGDGRVTLQARYHA